MCFLNFVLLFRINYKCNYGDAVYVVGNIHQLGNWNPSHALKLQWTEGHDWIQKIKIVHDNFKAIEYKYIIAPDNMTSPPVNIRWESGPNRLLNLLTLSILVLNLHDEWENFKVKIALHHEAVKKIHNTAGKKVVLITNLNFPNNELEMALGKSFVQNGMKDDWFWSVTFTLPNTVASFRYIYKIEGESAKQSITDREEKKFSFKTYHEPSISDKDYLIEGSIFTKYDHNIKTGLCYNAITDDILVGSFPNLKDVKDIADLGVRGVLNLQSFEDMERYDTDWEMLQKIYKESNIAAEHFPISDMNIDDLSLKMKDAVNILHELLKNGKVYVHCTAGKFRSPNIIVFYLCLYRKLSPKQAMKLMKAKRSKSKIIEEVIVKKYEKYILNDVSNNNRDS